MPPFLSPPVFCASPALQKKRGKRVFFLSFMGRPISPATSSLGPISSLSLFPPPTTAQLVPSVLSPFLSPSSLTSPRLRSTHSLPGVRGEREGQEKGEEEGVSSSSSVLFVSLLSLLPPFPHDSIARERERRYSSLSLSLSPAATAECAQGSVNTAFAGGIPRGREKETGNQYHSGEQELQTLRNVKKRDASEAKQKKVQCRP